MLLFFEVTSSRGLLQLSLNKAATHEQVAQS